MRDQFSRRSILSGIGFGASILAVPAWAQGHSMHPSSSGRAGSLIPAGFDEVSGPVIDLTVGSGHRIVAGRRGPGIAVNGSVPGPLIRLTEGQNVRINVTNNLDVDETCAWVGVDISIDC